MSKKTLVLGASENPARYANKAINSLQRHQHPVVAIGKVGGHVNNTPIETEAKDFEEVDTITIYLNPTHQEKYYDYILNLKPKRIIFNPGTENRELEALALANDIEPIQACTLVMLATDSY